MVWAFVFVGTVSCSGFISCCDSLVGVARFEHLFDLLEEVTHFMPLFGLFYWSRSHTKKVVQMTSYLIFKFLNFLLDHLL